MRFRCLDMPTPAMLSGFIAAALTPSSPAIVAASVIILCGIIFAVFYRPGVEVTG